MLELDEKLHYEELNRVLMRKIYLSEIDDAISQIRSARLNIDYATCSSSDLATHLGQPANPDPQTAARMAAWFSLAGWGGLLVSRSNDSEGFRKLTEIGKESVNIILKRPLPQFYGTTENEWIEYYINSEFSKLESNTKKFGFDSLEHFKSFASSNGYEFT